MSVLMRFSSAVFKLHSVISTEGTFAWFIEQVLCVCISFCLVETEPEAFLQECTQPLGVPNH